MKKNYIINGIFVLSTLAMLNSCQTVAYGSNDSKNEASTQPFKTISADSGRESLKTYTERTDGKITPATAEHLFNKLFELGNSPEHIEVRKQYLASISKPGENIYSYLAARRERKAKGIKLPGERKGIEEMADYRRKITMPIGSDNMLYEEGYLMKEYQKAETSTILSKAEKARFAPAANAASTYSLSNVTFTERGPNNIPGRDRSIVPSPANPDKWYVGSVGGGIWITDDGGKSWRNTTDYSVPSLATSTVAISPSNPQVVYAGTGEPFGNLDQLNGVGLLKSNDGGETWVYLNNTISLGSVGRLLVNPADANHLIIGTSKGVYVTRDGGANFKQVFSGANNNSNAQDLQASADFSALYASVNAYGILKSTDGGDTWTLIFDAASRNQSIKRMEIAVAPSDNNRIVLNVEGATSRLYFSDDAGTNFSELTYITSHDKNVLGGQGWYDNVIAINPFNKNIVYIGGVYLAKATIDPSARTYTVLQIASGYTKNRLNEYVHPDQHGLVCQVSPTDPTKFRMLLTNDGGVYYTDYKTNPGETEKDWFGPVKNLNTNQLYGADKKKGADLYIGGAQDNGSFAVQTEPASKTSEYTSIWGGDGFEVIWNYNDPKKLLMGSQYNNFVRLLGGLNSTLYWGKNADGGVSTESPFYSKLSNANNNPDVVFTVAKKGVWRTLNFGGSWSLVPFTTANNGTWLGNSSMATVKVSVADPNVVWAASAIGTNAAYKVNLSKDNGQTFLKTNGTFPGLSNNYYISGLSASRINPARAFVYLSVAGAPKIFKTNDFGESWNDITGFSNGVSTVGFPNVSVHSVLEMPFDEKIIWAGTDIGVFETVDGGSSWYLIQNLPPVSVWDMKIVDDQVVLATHGRGIWTAAIPELSSVTMPQYVTLPIIVSAAQAGIQNKKIRVVAKYTDPKITSLNVYVNNKLEGTISNTVPNTDYTFVTDTSFAQGRYTVGVSGVYDNGTSPATGKGLAIAETPKDLETAEIIEFNAGVENINLPAISTTDVFTPTDGKFVVDNVGGKFPYTVLNNSGHPYSNTTTYQTYLKTPIIVGSKSKLDISQIVATEAEYDYAYIEASTDLINWKTLGVFDESTFDNWKSVTAENINEELFNNSTVDFTTAFAQGDEVVVRFRLATDEATTGYGWFIKSVVPSATLSTNDVKTETADVIISPNPAKDNTDLYLPGDVKGKVTVAIYDASGKMISTQVRSSSSKINLDVKGLQKGVYLVLVKGDNISKAVKLLKE